MSETTIDPEESGRVEAATAPLAELRLLLSRLRRTLDCERVAVWVPAYGSADTEVLAAVGETVPWCAEGDPIAICRLPGPLHPPGPHAADDLGAPGRSDLETELRRHGFCSFAAIPLVAGEDRVGTLVALSRASGHLAGSAVSTLGEAAPILAAVTYHLLLLERHRQHARVLEIAHRILLDLAGEPDLRSAGMLVVRKLGVYLAAETSALFLRNPPSEWYSCEAVSRGDPAEVPGSGLLPGFDPRQVAAFGAALSGRPLHLPLPSPLLEGGPAILDALEPDGPGGLLVLPITRSRTVSGLLLCRRNDPQPPGRLLEAWPVLGDELGRLLENRRAVRVAAHDTTLLGDLLALQADVASGSPDQGALCVARRARSLVGADDAVVFALESDGCTLKPVAALGSHAPVLLALRIGMGEGIAGTVAATRRAELVNESHRDTRAVTVGETPRDAEAMLAVPLLAGDALHGVLTVHKLEGRTFDRFDLDRMEIFAAAAGSILRNATLAATLAAQADVLERTLDALPVGVLHLGPGGAVRRVNGPAREALGLGADGAPDGTLSSDAEAPAVDSLLRSIQRHVESRARSGSREVTLGGRSYLLILPEAEDPEDHSVAVLIDITDRKETEAQILQASKMSAVGQLAAGVAHEFNNLIAGIYGYAQLMKEHRDPKIVERGVEVILSSSERARELTSSLLSFSRRRPGRREPVDLNQVLTDTLLLMNRHLERSGVRVHRDLGRIPHTVADAARLQQVFLDLVLNAQQAMSAGGTLSVSTSREGEQIRIRVADTGLGISAQDLPRVFEPFFTTKGALGGASIPGTGLGLSAAYNIVQEHGGTIRAQSTAGKGSVFTIHLPVKTLHQREDSQPHARAHEPLDTTGRIAVIEDDAALRATMVEILEDLGHEVIEVGDGTAAPEVLAGGGFDMLIVDRMTEGMEDLSAYGRIRESHPKLPVLFLTGRGSSLESDGDPWMFRLNKPFRNRDLVALVSRVLSHSLENAS